MVSAFIGDVLDKIENEDVLNYTHRMLKERFGWDFEQHVSQKGGFQGQQLGLEYSNFRFY